METEEEKAAPKPKPTYPKGLDKEIFSIHDRMHDIANDRGHNSETDFRALFSVLLLEAVSSNIDERSGLIVELSYQKLGLGRRLVENDNEMADQAGAKTGVSASQIRSVCLRVWASCNLQRRVWIWEKRIMMARRRWGGLGYSYESRG